MEARKRLLTAGLLALAGVASAQQFYGDKKYGEFYEEEKKWTEAESKLPEFPSEQNLIEFDAGAASRNRYYVDGSSLNAGEDGVVRYVLVAKASGGARNLSFEGIRCSTRERKLYAFGRQDSTWSKARNPEWQSIRHGSYQAVLSKEYFCPGGAAILKAEEGIAALRSGGHPQAR